MEWGLFRIPERRLGVLGEVDGRDVLELGCGTAYLSAQLASAGARTVAVDLSPHQLRSARRLPGADRTDLSAHRSDRRAGTTAVRDVRSGGERVRRRSLVPPRAMAERGRSTAARRWPSGVPHQQRARGDVRPRGRRRRRRPAAAHPAFTSPGRVARCRGRAPSRRTVTGYGSCAGRASSSRRSTSSSLPTTHTLPSTTTSSHHEWARRWPAEDLWVARLHHPDRWRRWQRLTRRASPRGAVIPWCHPQRVGRPRSVVRRTHRPSRRPSGTPNRRRAG